MISRGTGYPGYLPRHQVKIGAEAINSPRTVAAVETELYEELRHTSEKKGNKLVPGSDLAWESIQALRYGKLEDATEKRVTKMEISTVN